MEFYLDGLTINLKQLDIKDILSCWDWLVKDLTQLLLISKFGDLFFWAKDGAVYWLATDMCNLTKVADSKPEFYRLLKDNELIENWFMPQLLKELEQEGVYLDPYQVYSYKKMPVLGGEYTIDNINPVDIKTHFELAGIIGEQIKDLPAGTKVKLKVTE
ncbi:T6SS immunity protein Tdi1 domain-containing protein [Mucilaginibacter kameinonensis]|uniref:T6SS immunity protein Tdi1 domain-containing protein n=1 Tax=Mucilaginibacter kameinonensis TaxID=452286 RepID=UPI000EF84FE2|nr:T6SS immunity protein Tdi1 domain-containing protein [Mucilaginibacter kameinonensis]